MLYNVVFRNQGLGSLPEEVMIHERYYSSESTIGTRVERRDSGTRDVIYRQ